MKIKSAEFVACAVNPQQYPTSQLPELALVGRSNVGKSSLINRFTNRRSLARTSSTPGKTQTLNFYLINGLWYFVDLPGYGYARVDPGTKARWEKMITSYLTKRPNLRGVLQLIDLRHPPSREDQQMFEWLVHYQLPRIIVATKADKLSRGRWLQHVKILRQNLGLSEQEEVVVFSAETGLGVEELGQRIEQLISNK
ncbi:MAG: YihA family ribosome biogenesis GTP-binding protein [Firmicutes bacterium]|nr:YihA family ribosome biogenesis GTP-binding protein [Bacillota bacterium]